MLLQWIIFWFPSVQLDLTEEALNVIFVFGQLWSEEEPCSRELGHGLAALDRNVELLTLSGVGVLCGHSTTAVFFLPCVDVRFLDG